MCYILVFFTVKAIDFFLELFVFVLVRPIPNQSQKSPISRYNLNLNLLFWFLNLDYTETIEKKRIRVKHIIFNLNQSYKDKIKNERRFK
jgi:hypothetical protein